MISNARRYYFEALFKGYKWRQIFMILDIRDTMAQIWYRQFRKKSLENVFSSYDFTCWGLRTELGCRVEPSIRHSCCFWCLFLLDAANSRHESRNEFNSSCTSRLCSLNLRNSPLFRLDKLYWCYLLAVLTAVGAAMAPSGKVPAMPSAMPFIDNFRVIRLPLEMAQSMLWDRMFRIAAFVWCREIFDK